jgi:hypothetical protein
MSDRPNPLTRFLRWADIGDRLGWVWVVLKFFLPSSLLAVVAERAEVVQAFWPLAAGLTLAFMVLFVAARSVMRAELKRTAQSVSEQMAEVRASGPQYDKRLAAEVNALKSKLATAERRTWVLNWEAEYRIQPPEVRPTTDKSELAKARTAILCLETQLQALARALGWTLAQDEGLINDIVTGFRDCGDQRSLPFVFASYFSADIGKPMVALLALLRFPGDEDIRLVFRAFFKQYLEFRKWPARAARYQQRQLSSFPHFAEWARADAELFAETRRLPNEGECSALRKFLLELAPGFDPGSLLDEADEIQWKEQDRLRSLENLARTEEITSRRTAADIERAKEHNRQALRPSVLAPPQVLPARGSEALPPPESDA